MARRVLITGVGSFWGGRVAQALEADPGVDVIIGLGVELPLWPAVGSVDVNQPEVAHSYQLPWAFSA